MVGRFSGRQADAVARVIWLPEAVADVERLYGFLYDINEQAAMKCASVIMQATLLLEDNPRLGRPMPDDSGRREIFAAFSAGSYVIRYRSDTHGNAVVVRVWHSREDR